LALKILLKENKKEIISSWFHLIVSFFPKETIDFIINEKDRFLNPIGSNISDGIGVIYDFVIGEKDKDAVALAIENMVKIMAVENIKPSIAISFGYHLKRILMERWALYLKDNNFLNEFNVICEKIDELTLMAFDFYTACREKINRIRIKELMSDRAIRSDNILNLKFNR